MRMIAFVSQLLIVLLCLTAYVSRSSLNGEFVFDDTVAIVNNQDVIKQPTNLNAIFHNDFWGATLTSKDSHKSYRPLTTLMFHIEYAWLHFRAKEMKIVNLLLHCVNSLLVWHLLTKFQADENPQGTIASALFALHPVHVEPVSGVVGRADLMFCLLYLLTLLSVPKSGEISNLSALFIVILTSLGVLFKETAITIPLACVFVSYIKREFYNLTWRQQVQRLFTAPNAVLAISTVILMVLRFWLQGFEAPQFKPMDNPIAFAKDNASRIYTQLYLYVLNLWILLFPQWLCFDWALGCIELVKNIWDWRLQAVPTLCSLIALIMLKSSQNPDALLALGLLVIPFLPASGIIKVGFVIAERVLYVPSIGYCFLVANSFLRLLKGTKPKWLRTLYKMLLMLVFLCFLLRTRQRASEWQNEEKLYQSALKVCPKNAKVHYNIARLASDKSDHQKAMHFYHNAIDLYPEYEAALMNLGNLYREIGDFVTAEKYLRASLQVFPEFAAAWMNLGIVQAAQKQYSNAAESYHNALLFRPNYAICYYNLGNLYLEQKMFTLAMQNWQKSVVLNAKQPKAWANILQMLDNRGLLEDGLRLSNEALKHLPNETSILFIRANLLGKHKQYVEAEAIYKKIVHLQPKNLLFHTNFAVLYHRWGKLNQAIEFYQRAISIDPDKAITAKDNLDKLLKRLQREEHTLNNRTENASSISIEKR